MFSFSFQFSVWLHLDTCFCFENPSIYIEYLKTQKQKLNIEFIKCVCLCYLHSGKYVLTNRQHAMQFIGNKNIFKYSQQKKSPCENFNGAKQIQY